MRDTTLSNRGQRKTDWMIELTNERIGNRKSEKVVMLNEQSERDAINSCFSVCLARQAKRLVVLLYFIIGNFLFCMLHILSDFKTKNGFTSDF